MNDLVTDCSLLLFVTVWYCKDSLDELLNMIPATEVFSPLLPARSKGTAVFFNEIVGMDGRG